nr:MAG TPA: hypothetical protein [Caudoviricetes sp.]
MSVPDIIDIDPLLTMLYPFTILLLPKLYILKNGSFPVGYLINLVKSLLVNFI